MVDCLLLFKLFKLTVISVLSDNLYFWQDKETQGPRVAACSK